MNKLNHIFFDLDRTLWDFETNSKAALVQIFDELKLADHIPTFEVFYKEYRVVNAAFWDKYTKGIITKADLRAGRFAQTLEKFNVVNDQLSHQLGERYIQVSPYQTNLFPDTKETLEELKNNEHQLHIITNGFKEVQFIKLENSGILNYFDDILCSEEVGVNKPNPLVFQKALERTKAKKSESIMIGDDFNADVLGAEKCGIRGVLFDPHDHHAERSGIERIQSLNEIPAKIIGL
ncbi:MAG: YjjG family noncanonical pyrimidine nucleotidase [Brumimicrobium sp.]